MVKTEALGTKDPLLSPFCLSQSAASKMSSLRHFGKTMPQEATVLAMSGQEDINLGLQ